MCIKLIRHFECENDAAHIVKNLIRCSTPPHTLDVGLNLVDQYCFLVPVEVEEWYTETCPDCTGEGQLPQSEPQHKQVRDMDKLPDYIPKEDMWDEIHTHRGPSHQYAQTLADFLFFVFTSRKEGDEWTHIPDPLLPDPPSPQRNIVRLRERFRLMFREILCRYHPVHGGAYQLYEDVHPDVPTQSEYTFSFSDTCDCAAMEKPYLNNALTNIRINCARKLLENMCNNQPGDHARNFMGDQKEIIDAYTALTSSFNARSEDVRVPLEILRPLEYDVLRARVADLKVWIDTHHDYLDGRLNDPDDSIWGGLSERDREYENWHIAMRRHLLDSVVVELVSRDSGLTLDRQRDVIKCFIRHFLMPPDLSKPNAISATPRVNDGRPFDRLRYLFKRYMTGFHEQSKMHLYLLEFYDRHHGLQTHRFYQKRWDEVHSVQRLVIRNMLKHIVPATDEDMAKLPEDSRLCPICLDDMTLLDPEATYLRPAQGRACYNKKRSHWFCRPCLVQEGLKRTIVAKHTGIREPLCPMCRTPYAMPKTWLKMDIEDGKLTIYEPPGFDVVTGREWGDPDASDDDAPVAPVRDDDYYDDDENNNAVI